jgi:uncharacterized damage-inducible protein DinB
MSENLLQPVLDSWERNNTILLNLLKALPEGGLDARAMEGSPSIAFLFSHMHETRYFWLSKTVPELAGNLPNVFRQEGDAYLPERDPQKITAALNASAKAVADTVKDRIETDAAMKGEHASYDHPVLFLQHMLWHEGYHVGQIKLALKAAGHVLSDEQEEKAIWSLWRTEVW